MDYNTTLEDVHSQGDQRSDDIIEGGTPATSTKTRGLSLGPVALLDGRTRKISTNELGQPNGSDDDSMAFKTAIGVNTRKYVSIACESFHFVPLEQYDKVLVVLQENFDYEGVSAVYLRERVNIAWRNHTHNIHKKYIKGKNLAMLRNSAPLSLVNREEWQWFLNYTSNEKYKATSLRNVINQSKLKAPNTLGRCTMAVIRHMIAKERKLKSDFEVGRADIFEPILKRTRLFNVQKLLIKFERLRVSLPSPTILVRVTDVLTQVLGKDRSGHMRGMGAGVNITMVKKNLTLLRKHEVQQAENSTTNLKVDMLGKELEKIKDMILKSQVTTPAECNIGSSPPTAPSKHSSQSNHPSLNKQYDMYVVGGALVASGEVVEVAPQVIVHGIALGEGSYKILLTDVHDKNAMLFLPRGGCDTLGEVGANGYVAWPVTFLKASN